MERILAQVKNEEMNFWAMEQCLEGFLYKNYDDQILRERFHDKWVETSVRNLLYFRVLEELNSYLEAEEIYAIALKGIVLLNDAYGDVGSRTLGDLDLLVKEEDMPSVVTYFENVGFSRVEGEKWKANRFKETYTKTIDGIEIAVELHTQLFWEQKFVSWEAEKFIGKNLLKLKIDDFLVHLFGHVSYQHTFLKFHWILDIALLMRKHMHEINWTRILFLSRRLGHCYSTRAVIFALKKYFDINLGKLRRPFFMWRDLFFFVIFTDDFILFPMRHRFRYYLLKHLTSISLAQSLKYDVLWLRNRLWKR